MDLKAEEGTNVPQDPPLPTLADIPLLPRRRLRDGTAPRTRSTHSLGSGRSSRGSSIASSSRSSSTSRSHAPIPVQGTAVSKKKRPTRGLTVQRLRGGMTRTGGNKEDAVEIGDSDDEGDNDIELIENGAGSTSISKHESKRRRNGAASGSKQSQEKSLTVDRSQTSSSRSFPTSHLPPAFQEYAKSWTTDYPETPGPRLWSLTNLFSPPSTSASELNGNVGERYAMIILNQPITRDDVFRRAWKASRFRYCADGGANRLYDHLDPSERESYLPDMIKGDLDSLRDDVREFYSDLGVEVKKDPSQNSTDLMKCIEEIEAQEEESGSDEQIPILLIGGLSGRVDQTVHTMSLLHKIRTTRDEVYVLNGESVAWVLDEGSHLIDIDHKTMGQTCAPMPIGVESSMIKTKGLKWDIDGESSMFGLMSTSNHLLPENPAVWLETSRPILWCIEIKDTLPTLTE